MRTLYIRRVPDDVAERLEGMADQEDISLNELVLRELTEVAMRNRNAELFANLPSLPITADEAAALVREARAERDAQLFGD